MADMEMKLVDLHAIVLFNDLQRNTVHNGVMLAKKVENNKI